jgi:hypothetical protein
MPNESEQTQQQTQDTSASTQQQQTSQQQTQQTQQQTSQTQQQTPGSTGNNSGEWERERRGLIAETQKERQARQKYEQDYKALQTQHEQAQKRIQALAGVNPKSEQETQDEEIRRAFAEKFPELATLTKEDIEAIREMRNQTAQLTASTQAMWKKHTTQVMNAIHEKVADKLGSDVKSLSDRQKASLRREYIAYIEEHQIAGQDYVSRHEDADESLFDEFVEAYLKDWQDPIRRSVTSTEINRRPLPSGKGRSIATTGPKKIDFKNEKSVQDAAVEAFLAHGGGFGQ